LAAHWGLTIETAPAKNHPEINKWAHNFLKKLRFGSGEYRKNSLGKIRSSGTNKNLESPEKKSSSFEQ
jgi:hypothetical protein